MMSHLNRSIGEVGDQKPTEESAPPPNDILVNVVSMKKSTLEFFNKTKVRWLEFRENHKADFKYLLLIIPIVATFFLAKEVQKNQSLRSRAGSVVLSLSSNNQNPQPGETFIVAVGIDTKGASVSASDIEIKYDPTLLELVSWKAGGFLPVILLPASSSADTLTLTVGSEPTDPKSGMGVLAEATFKTKAEGQTGITFTPNTAVAAVGQQDNVVGELNPLQLTLGTIATQPPPSATETPIPPSSEPTPTPPTTGETASVDHWDSTQGEVCFTDNRDRDRCTTVINGVNIYGFNYGTGPVNVTISDTQGHTFQGSSNVTKEGEFDVAWVSVDNLKAAGFPYTGGYNGSTVYVPEDFGSWSITITR